MIITVSAIDVTGKLFLSQVVGEGHYGDEAFELDVTLPSMSPLVRVGGKTYLVNIRDIVGAVLEAAREEVQATPG